MVGLERLLARCIALITLKPYNLTTSSYNLTSEATLQPHNLRIVYERVRLER